METQELTIGYVSSSGASLTDNTNREILCIAELVEEAPKKKETYKSWQELLEEKGGFNTSNTRNICPLLQNMGFLEYGKKECEREKFLTETGKQYAIALKLIDAIKNLKNSQEYLLYASSIKRLLVYQGLKTMLLFSGATYNDVLVALLRYLYKYQSVCKDEFCVLLNGFQKNPKTYLDDIDDLVSKLRKNVVQITVNVVKARDGITQEGNSSITAFGYHMKLLEESGLVFEKDDKYVVVPEKVKWIKDILLEVENE